MKNKIKAFKYYKKYIYNIKKYKLYEFYNFSIPGTISYKDWELLAAILLNEKSNGGQKSPDLESHEVKSAVQHNTGYEYQYAKNCGMQKLKNEKNNSHVFINYSSNYKNIIVRLISGKKLEKIFDSWVEGFVNCYSYDNSNNRRYRKTVCIDFVNKNGKVIFEIKNGKMVLPKLNIFQKILMFFKIER